MSFFSKQSGSNKRGRSVLRTVFVALVFGAAMGVLAGCSSSDDPIDAAGTWTWTSSTSSYTERWTITDSSIHFESAIDGTTFTTTYRADVVEYVNGRLNADDTELTAGRSTTSNPGFAIIRYTEVNAAFTGEVGKYNVFRWADNVDDNSLRDLTQGAKDADPDENVYVNDVFDSASEAESGATNANGYFALSSNGAVRQ